MNKTITNMVSIAEQTGLFNNEVWKMKKQKDYICVYHHQMLILVVDNSTIKYVYCQSKHDFNVIKYILDTYHIKYENINYISSLTEFHLKVDDDITWHYKRYYRRGFKRMLLHYKNQWYTWDDEEIFDHNRKMVQMYDKLV